MMLSCLCLVWRTIFTATILANLVVIFPCKDDFFTQSFIYSKSKSIGLLVEHCSQQYSFYRFRLDQGSRNPWIRPMIFRLPSISLSVYSSYYSLALFTLPYSMLWITWLPTDAQCSPLVVVPLRVSVLILYMNQNSPHFFIKTRDFYNSRL